MVPKSRIPFPLQALEYMSSNNHIFVLNHSLQPKLGATDSSMSVVSSNMRFCMDIFHPEKDIRLYIVIGGMAEVGTGWNHI